MKTLYSLFLFLLAVSFSFSQTEVPSFFTDHMVLQQQDTVSIWGKDTPGTAIKLEASWGGTAEAKTETDGRWKAVLKTPRASFEAQTLTIKGSSTIDLNNILIGEVWFCSGQLNMEMPVKGFGKSPVNRSDTFLATSENPNIRLFNAPRAASLSPENNIPGEWEQATRESVSEFSAVGYFFGRKLYQELQIPIGIIESSWGGTQIEAWLPKNKILNYSEISVPKNLPEEENQRRKPTALYNGMIHPFQDYGIRGILWYQGESNRNNPAPYKDYMHDLVEAWRTQWNRPELPFYFVQISPYGYAEYRNGNVMDANLIREAQALAAQEIPNTGIAVTTDVGKCDDIHPPEKETIAKRLANMALARQYGVEDVAYKSPEYESMEIKGNKIELAFDFGEETPENQQLESDRNIKDMVIAGQDKKFYPAEVSVNDDQTLTIYNNKVQRPVAVRYGFVDCLEGSLFSAAGLPVSPFRTDSWEEAKVNVDGELKKWHRITLSFEGPETSELAEVNPFLDYRLDVTFSNGESNYTVPGFYAADGNAAETSGDSGKVWMVRFTPDKTGQWTYTTSFEKGKNIAVAENAQNGKSAGFTDGKKGTFTIADSDKNGIDNRSKGRLNYVGESYLKFAETGDYFIKLGVDAPENLLGYQDFDASTNALGHRKNWQPHARDFEADAESFLWQGNRGKNLLGAISYLASEELNVFSFLTFNVDGDDRNIFPHLLKIPVEEYEAYASDKKNKMAWESMFHKTRLDVSKLEQWERIFEYAERKGMFLHFKTNETETDHLMDGGVFGTEGKLYYRELIARFGHHLALNWNLGEENDQPISNVIEIAEYIKKLDAYDHHRVVHTFPNRDDRYQELIGNRSVLTGASLQLSDPEFKDVHPRVLKWKRKSDSTGVKWALSVDEPGKANTALLPDDENPEHNLARGNALWGTLMAGGYGVEWYFGYASPNSDLTAQDFRSRDLFWDQNRHALHFFEEYLPFWEMEPADELTSDDSSFCLAKKDEVYTIYLPMGLKTTSIDLGNSGKKFTVNWYNPRNGGDLQKGSVETVEANGEVEVGLPPSSVDKDWVVYIK